MALLLLLLLLLASPLRCAAAEASAVAPSPASAASDAAEAALTSCMQPPAMPGRGCAISPTDRVYTGDQSSNTITVIAPYDGTVLGTLSLGDVRLANVLGPQYSKAVNAHGLGFSRDGRLIVSTSVTSNTVTVIRTRDNRIVSQTSVDRQAHEAAFAADNATVWVATRGVDSIDIVNGLAGGVIGRVASQGGPSKVLFSPDGRTAYANHVRAATLDVIDVEQRVVTHTITGLNDTFSSDMGLSPDGAVMVSPPRAPRSRLLSCVHALRRLPLLARAGVADAPALLRSAVRGAQDGWHGVSG